MHQMGSTDAEIRAALHQKHLRRLRARPDTLIIDELGLAHAKSRIDVAVIDGRIHGYEIKSDKDNLNRLRGQLEFFRKSLQKLTLVVAPRHLDGVLHRVPLWCGVISARRGPRGAIIFERVRTAKTNPSIDPFLFAHLLWRPEALRLLADLGYAGKELQRPRRQLYEMLTEELSPNQLATAVVDFMRQRSSWRDPPAHG